jgi:hypothetical protein
MSEPFPFIVNLIFGNSQKLQGAKSGEYGRWENPVMSLSAKIWRMTRNLWHRGLLLYAAQIRYSIFPTVFVAHRFVGILTDLCSIPSSQWCFEARTCSKNAFNIEERDQHNFHIWFRLRRFPCSWRFRCFRMRILHFRFRIATVYPRVISNYQTSWKPLNLNSHDYATPTISTGGVIYVLLTKVVKQISHSLLSCSNFSSIRVSLSQMKCSKL